jgi:hypothetical protein
VTTKSRAHTADGEDASADHHALVQKYLRMVQSERTNTAPDRPYGENQQGHR